MQRICKKYIFYCNDIKKQSYNIYIKKEKFTKKYRHVFKNNTNMIYELL